ncbi:MAG TPA: protein kinase [Polaromonas sp.]|uniref:protein kinase domain-containing protein n=1 Tax=Polaromonas sp. TaxID=1869339 RepID=UPI002D674C8E|nr:protein kinase [Polaromonas sp.]HYW57874.1 protein kinase [Polaromonas sp.]
MNTIPVMDTERKAASIDPAALPPGHKIFEYRIDKTLGGGGFGITYLAQDINLELPVAIKEYFPGDVALRAADLSVNVRTADGEKQFHWGLERFLDEARALAAFRHPNIIRVLRYFKVNGTAYIVMEYESGDPLKRWLARLAELNQKTLLKVVYPLLDGLESVHKLDFLHRDIKPDNIYIRADGTPVLLDFGAARRLVHERDMTNIVSPGFAPFEQYHSQGNQGPWTDLYSLGAVMYWMATGEKPVEAAARVQIDTMPKAAAIGDACVFGDELLRAIDWALTPDEKSRPQRVSDLREALVAAEHARDDSLTLKNRPMTDSQTGPSSDVLAFVAKSQSVSGGSADKIRRNVLGTVMVLTLVGYTRQSVDDQVVIKARFNELMDKSLRGVPEDSRVVIDAGDGAATCFLGDPEEALQSAMLLRSLLLQKYGQMLSMRIGMHLGPIRILTDVNQQVTVVGDGINVAQRIAAFAHPNQIVVSRAYYDIISRITDHAIGMFNALGPHLDQHLRSHEIYAVLDLQSRPQHPPVQRHSEFENTASFAALASLTPEMVAEIEVELAKSIGPLAKVLVKKAVPRSISAQGLRDLLAVSIPDPTARDLFIRPKSHKTLPPTHSGSRSDASIAFSRTMADVSQPISGRSGPVSSPNFSDSQLALLERALSQFIGPLAKMILRKEVARHTSLQALRQALAAQIDKPGDREKFLSSTHTPH